MLKCRNSSVEQLITVKLYIQFQPSFNNVHIQQILKALSMICCAQVYLNMFCLFLKPKTLTIKIYIRSKVYQCFDMFSGKQTRHRRVESASITLSACPHLEESRDCSVGSCFTWKMAQKDPCFLPKSRSCGRGTRKLFFSCVNHLGVSLSR